MGANQILVVDDEAGIRELLSEILQDEGYQVKLAENAQQARTIRSQGRPDLVLLDIWMPDCDGITLLREWATAGQLTMPVIMMSGHGTIDTAVQATRIGAFDFLEKPITLQKLLKSVDRAISKGSAQTRATLTLSGLGKGKAITEFRNRLAQVAHLKTPLLLLGEKGAGAELCARYVHTPHTPWLAPEANRWLTESPLDVLSQVRDGLLFVRELAALNKMEQKGLLLLMDKWEKYNVRLVCATSEPLGERIKEGAFDALLFHSLSGVTLTIPSLRDHREDIPDLANALLLQFIESQNSAPRHFSIAALNSLRNENWPGNLPQFTNVIKTLASTSLEEEITAEDVRRVLEQFGTGGQNALPSVLKLDAPFREARDDFERIYFEYHISKLAGNMSRVAEKVELERTHLYRKLKQLGIKTAKKIEE